MSPELDYYRLVVKHRGRLNDWVVYDRNTSMNRTVAQTKSDAIKKAKAVAEQWMLGNTRMNRVGIEKRTKTGKKSYEVVRG